ncbi:MAG: hypothetical protein K5637_00285 [Lachnospiraceae bacterium]|nr:hypothetical protein [Lachnospiraceae bacterium]
MRRRLASIILTVFMVFSMSTTSFAASSKSYLMYNQDLSPGRITDIGSLLTAYGYSNYNSSDPTKSTLINRLNNGSIVFFHTHGNSSGGVLVTYRGNLKANDLTSAGVDLAYLSACYSGKSSTSNGYFPTKLSSLGVNMSVSFSSTISATTSTNGIHHFNYLVFKYLTQGYTLASAVSYAESYVFSTYGQYYGCNNVVIVGTWNTL